MRASVEVHGPHSSSTAYTTYIVTMHERAGSDVVTGASMPADREVPAGLSRCCEILRGSLAVILTCLCACMTVSLYSARTRHAEHRRRAGWAPIAIGVPGARPYETRMMHPYLIEPH